MSIYISGPMSGYEDFNYAAFHAAEAAIRRVRQDAQIINPASVQLWQGAEWTDWMRHHVATIAREVTEIVVLPDWETSRGARLEVHIAHALGIPVKPLDAWLRTEEALMSAMADVIDGYPASVREVQ